MVIGSAMIWPTGHPRIERLGQRVLEDLHVAALFTHRLVIELR